jgi:hypothetical protein
MKESACFKDDCPNCSGRIEFPVHGLGEEVACPHCQQSIVLRFPNDGGSNPTEQLDAYLEMASFPKTRAELLFLKIFTFPTELTELRGAEMWQQALRETPEVIVSRFIASGMLQHGNVEVTRLLQSKSKDELKSLAKTRNLGQSGTKELLAIRLFKADPSGMSEFFRGKTYFSCTAKGQLIVEKFVESERELMLKAERPTESALRSGSYEEACSIVATFEASRVFQRGVGLDWSKYDATRDLEVLKEIARYQSKRNRDIPELVLRSLRVSAGMMNLWGTSKPEKWLTESEREFAIEAHVILSAAIARVNLREMKRIGIAKVEVLGCGRDDTCAVCKGADRTTYEIAFAPELPHEDCSCESGCGCLLVAAQ